MHAASSYSIRCYSGRAVSGREEMRKDEGNCRMEDESGSAGSGSGSERRANVTIPWPNEVFYFAVVAGDEVRAEGGRRKSWSL